MASFALGRGVFVRVGVCVGVGCTVAIFLLGGGAARGSGAGGAPSSWVRERAGSPAGSVFTSLTGVSCVSGGVCVAVGNWDRRGRHAKSMPLIERSDGSRWFVQRNPGPAGGELVGVSCSSARACMASGEDSKQSPFVERWDGSRWSVQRVPSGAGGSAGGVTCRSSTWCELVGGDGVWHWDGRRWSVQWTEDRGDLGAIACTSKTMCVAVGSGGNGWPLAAGWNGRTWSLQRTRSPDGGQGGDSFNSVSCTSRTTCLAVGFWNPGGNGSNFPLAERWGGRRWSMSQPRDLKISYPNLDGDLNAVSCVSALDCLAVGDTEYGRNGNSVALAETWTDRTWVFVRLLKQTLGHRACKGVRGFGDCDASLAAMSCVSGTVCTAVGSFEVVASDGNEFRTVPVVMRHG